MWCVVMVTSKTNIVIFLSILVGIVLIVNVVLLTGLSGAVDEQREIALEAAILPKVELVVLFSSSCADCFDTTAIVSQFSGANVTSEKKIEYDSEEGKVLVAQYNISKIPAVIVTGEISKSTAVSSFLTQVGKKSGDAVVIESPIPPFIDAANGEVRGKVSLTVITKKDCAECFDLNPLVEQLKSTLSVSSLNEYDSFDPEALKLISKYDIDGVPTLLFDSEASVYPMISEVWPMVGTIEDDGTYVMRNLNPPFYNLTSRRLEGLVTLTVLTDASCTTCYDAVKVNSAILAQLGVKLKETKQVDISSVEGKELISSYKVTRVPTILLTGDMAKYPTLGQSWAGVGTVEKDGTYVLRKLEVFNSPFMDLESGKLVTPTVQGASQAQGSVQG